ncbi:MAG: hypothetical protein Q9166_004883 [cf. Caloplaca sp. 2 TL-2023]
MPAHLETNATRGDEIPASCISLRVNKIRKDARGKGVTSMSTASIRAPAQRRPAKVASFAQKRSKAVTDDVSDETEEEKTMKMDSDDKPALQQRTPGKDNIISGRITKPRKSPRASSVAKKDYGKMIDPYNDFGHIVDGNGDAIFARQGMTPEDSLDSDKEYKKHGDEGSAAVITTDPGQTDF